MTSAHLLTAIELARAAQTDPQLAPPTQPRLVAGIEPVVFDEGLALLNGWQPVILRGQAARILFPRLLPVLDGRATAAQLAQRLEVPEAAVRNALVLLRAAGVLEEGELSSPDDPLANWLARTVDSLRAQPNGVAAAGALRGSQVSLVGDDAGGRMLSESLAACGVSVMPTDEPTAGDLAVRFVIGRERAAELGALDDTCAALGVPWLRVRCTADRLELGPLFARGQLPCYACFRTSTQAGGGGAAPTLADLRVWVELAALEVVALLSRAFPEASGMRLCRLTHEWTLEQRVVSRMKGCGRCGLGPDGSEPTGEASVVLQQEAADATPPAFLRNRRASMLHYLPIYQELHSQLRIHPGAEHYRLPPANLDLVDQTGDHKLTASRLATLLGTAYGLRTPGDAQDRYAPSAGNLGSAEAFLALQTVDGIKAGLYAYEPMRHGLAGLRRPPEAAQAIRARLGLPDFDALCVQVAARARLAAKYGGLADRLMQLDAGVVLGQLKVVARALGIAVATCPTWDGALLRDALDLDPDDVITACLELRGEPGWARHRIPALTDFLRSRRSHRAFGSRPLDRDRLEAVLAAAAAEELAVRVVAGAVSGVPAGVYASAGKPLDLQPVGAQPAPDFWPQPEFHQAPAILVMVGDVSRDAQGAFVRQLQMAGEALYHADLIAHGLGMGGCMFTGPIGLAAAALGCDGYRAAPLMAYAFGERA